MVLILADDLGYSDLGCYGSEIPTPNLDRLAGNGVRFSQFYNGARCCPTRAAVLTGLYAHQAGVGHMTGAWNRPGYAGGLNERCATIAEILRTGGYRSYHVGKWHVGGVGKGDSRNHPINRGFDRARGTGGGGNFFKVDPVYRDLETVPWEQGKYATDVFTDWAVELIQEHQREQAERPFFLNVCYTAPHFPLHAKPKDIEKHVGKYRGGWDELRAARFRKQQELGILNSAFCALSPRDPVAKPWEEVSNAERDEWDRRMAVHAAMVDCMDQGIGRIRVALSEAGIAERTVIMFLSDNGASAEALDSWPNPARGHKPGSIVGTAESHRCLEIGWANAANTPFRESKMWVHEGGISTPFIMSYAAGHAKSGAICHRVGHIIDIMPTILDLAKITYPETLDGRALLPLEGSSLLPLFNSPSMTEVPRTIGWEHEGNRAIRMGDWKLVASFRGRWELYDMLNDRSETRDLAPARPDLVERLSAEYQKWADRVGVIDWEQLPGANYKPTSGYRKKSEPVTP